MCDHESTFKNKYCPDCGVKSDFTDKQKENFCNYLSKKFIAFKKEKKIVNIRILFERFFAEDEDARAVKWRLEGQELIVFRVAAFFFDDQFVKINPNLKNWRKYIERMDIQQLDIDNFKIYYYENSARFKRLITLYEKYPTTSSSVLKDINIMITYAEIAKKCGGFTSEQLKELI